MVSQKKWSGQNPTSHTTSYGLDEYLTDSGRDSIMKSGRGGATATFQVGYHTPRVHHVIHE